MKYGQHLASGQSTPTTPGISSPCAVPEPNSSCPSTGATSAPPPPPTGSLTAGHPDSVRGIHLGENLDSTDPFTGTLDEMRIHTRALSAAELDAMRAANTTPANGLALHLPLNNTSNPAP